MDIIMTKPYSLSFTHLHPLFLISAHTTLSHQSGDFLTLLSRGFYGSVNDIEIR